jgi:hypothetical protein
VLISSSWHQQACAPQLQAHCIPSTQRDKHILSLARLQLWDDVLKAFWPGLQGDFWLPTRLGTLAVAHCKPWPATRLWRCQGVHRLCLSKPSSRNTSFAHTHAKANILSKSGDASSDSLLLLLAPLLNATEIYRVFESAVPPRQHLNRSPACSAPTNMGKTHIRLEVSNWVLFSRLNASSRLI